jgi:hypothetical protein
MATEHQPETPALPGVTRWQPKRIVVEAHQWHANGDHPDDNCRMITPDRPGTTESFWSEGEMVRYYRNPDDDGQRECGDCGVRMHDHGWIDQGLRGDIVCPGDFVVSLPLPTPGLIGDFPVRPDVFAAAYEPAGETGAPAVPPPPVAAASGPLVMPADEFAVVKSACRMLAKAVTGQNRAMQAARIEMAQGNAPAAVQWILNSLPDVWDDPETEWDGTESANEWWDRTEGFYRVAEGGDEKAPAVPSPPVAAVLDREALGRIVHETRCAENAKKDRPFVLEPWERRAPSQQELDMKIAEAVAAAVRERSDEEGPDRG